MLIKKSYLTILIAGFTLAVLLTAGYVASQILIPSIIQKNGKDLLGVPVRVEKGGFNFINATLWLEDLQIGNVPNAREPVFLSIKHFELNLSFVSIFANEFIVEDIRLFKPVLNLERDSNGNLNSDLLARQFKQMFRPRLHVGKFNLFQRYAIQHFEVKNGTIRHYNQNASSDQKEWVFRDIDFSFSEFNYPPRLDSPVTTSFYLSSQLSGREEGKIRILGSGVFLANDKNFKIKSIFQNIVLRDFYSLNSTPVLPGAMDGFIDVNSVISCEHNLLKIDNKVKLKNISLPENNGKKTEEIIFGFSRKTLSRFFELTKGQPFQFDFSVSGNLSDPSFDLREKLSSTFLNSVHDAFDKSIDRLNSGSMQRVEKLIAGEKSGESNPAELFRQLVEKFTEKQTVKKTSTKNPAPSKA